MENSKKLIDRILNRKTLKHINYVKLKPKIKKQLNEICEYYDYEFLELRLNNIKNFIEYNVEDEWVERLYKIKFQLKNDSSSLYSFKVRYGDIGGQKLFNLKSEKSKINEINFTNKYGEVEGKKKWLEFRGEFQKSKWGEKYYIEKHGEVEGKKKWESALNKKIITQRERKEKIGPYKNGQTLIEYQNRYGIVIGLEKYNEKKKN